MIRKAITVEVSAPVAEATMRRAVKRLRRPFHLWCCWVVGTTVPGLVTYASKLERTTQWAIKVRIPYVDADKQAAIRTALRLRFYALAAKRPQNFQYSLNLEPETEHEPSKKHGDLPTPQA